MTSANAPDRKDRAVTDGQGRDGGRRSSQKSDAAFRTISEVAIELDVPQHVLRFWETKFSQIRPMKRGGGRRYYRPEDVVLLTTLRDLLYREGYTIKGVQKLLRENGVKALVHVVHERRERTEGGESVGPVGPVLSGATDPDDDEDDAPAHQSGDGLDASAAPDAERKGRTNEPAADAHADPHGAPASGDNADYATQQDQDQGSATHASVASDPGAALGLSDAQRAHLEAAIDDLTDLRQRLGAALDATAPPPAPPAPNQAPVSR